MKEPILERCHLCGSYKAEGDVGVYHPWKIKDEKTEHISWFCTEEHQKTWIAQYAEKIQSI